jgi:hypothetical protein
MQTQRTGVAATAERVRRLWPRRISERQSSPSPDVGREHRFETLEARIAHLETALEGLQDALYRHEVLERENLGELNRRTDPEQMARDLSEDTRKRGL